MHRTFSFALLIACIISLQSPSLAQLLSDDDVTAETGSAAIGGDNFGNITIGLTPQEVRELVGQIMAEANVNDDQLIKLATNLGVTRTAVTTFLGILGEEHVEQSKLTQKLVEIAQQHNELRKRLGALQTNDPLIGTLRDQAQNAIGQGDYDAADSFLTQAETADIAAALSTLQKLPSWCPRASRRLAPAISLSKAML